MGDTPMTSRLLSSLRKLFGELLTLARTEGGELLSVRAKIKLLEAGHFVPTSLQPAPVQTPRQRPQLYLVRSHAPYHTTATLARSAR